MANLVNLQDFETEYRKIIPLLNNFHNSINYGVVYKTWSQKQRDDLVQMQYAVTALYHALGRLVDGLRKVP